MIRNALFVLVFAVFGCASLTGNRAAKPGVAPMRQAELRDALLALNRETAPWILRDGAPEGTDLIMEWKIVDARWSGIFSRAGLRKTFKIYLLLDETKHTVRTLDEEWEIAWRAGVPELHLSASYQRGQVIETSWGKAVAFTEMIRPGVIYEYRFGTSEMKDPLADTVVERGWNMEGALSKASVARAR